MNDETLFPATIMPDSDWWHVLWPTPETVLTDVGVSENISIIDLCCGDGLFTESMCQLVSPNKVWALDLDEHLLKQAENRCAKYTNFQAILGNAMDLPRQINEPVDYVFMANTFHGVPNKAELSQVICDILKKGGRFTVVNWHKRPREETPVLDLSRGPSTKLRMTPNDVRLIVEPIGFELDEVVEVGPYHYASIFGKK